MLKWCQKTFSIQGQIRQILGWNSNSTAEYCSLHMLDSELIYRADDKLKDSLLRS